MADLQHPPITRCQRRILLALQDARKGWMTGESLRIWLGYSDVGGIISPIRVLCNRGVIVGLDTPPEGEHISIKNQRWMLTPTIAGASVLSV